MRKQDRRIGGLAIIAGILAALIYGIYLASEDSVAPQDTMGASDLKGSPEDPKVGEARGNSNYEKRDVLIWRADLYKPIEGTIQDGPSLKYGIKTLGRLEPDQEEQISQRMGRFLKSLSDTFKTRAVPSTLEEVWREKGFQSSIELYKIAKKFALEGKYWTISGTELPPLPENVQYLQDVPGTIKMGDEKVVSILFVISDEDSKEYALARENERSARKILAETLSVNFNSRPFEERIAAIEKHYDAIQKSRALSLEIASGKISKAQAQEVRNILNKDIIKRSGFRIRINRLSGTIEYY